MLRYLKHNTFYWYIFYYNRLHWIWGVDKCRTESKVSHTWVIYATYTRVGTLIVATIYLQLIQN